MHSRAWVLLGRSSALLVRLLPIDTPRVFRALLLGWVLLSPSLGSAGVVSEPGLRFIQNGMVVREMGRPAIVEKCGAVRVEVDDPYYDGPRRFHACPLEKVLTAGFSLSAEELRQESFLLRASDGFVKPVAGARLLEPGGFAAFADADLTDPERARLEPVWEPIDRRQVDPGPFFLVWVGVSGDAAHAYPWPYQWVEVEIASLSTFYPHVAPRGVTAESVEARGYRVFAENCISCHAVNGEGGRVGPDLNIPRGIVEYRPVEQLKAFIRNPSSFRYTTMPAHEHLAADELDALIAYFRIMQNQKHDPNVAVPVAP